MDCRLEIKSSDDDGYIEGLGAVFGNVDLGLDRIEFGAFEDTLKEINGATIPMLWQHHDDEPIGVWDYLAETKKGLEVKGQINLDVQKGREARALVKQGAVKGLSIGYWPLDFRYEEEVRVLERIKLHETSLATFPMNTAARVAGIKNMTRKELEQDLRELLGLSRHLASRAAFAIRKAMDEESRLASSDDDSTDAEHIAGLNDSLRKLLET